MVEPVLMTLLFAEGLIGCVLAIRYFELKMTFSSYICINKSGYGIFLEKKKAGKNIRYCFIFDKLSFIHTPSKNADLY